MSRVRVLRVIARTNVGGPSLQVRSLMSGLDPDRFESVLVAGAVGPDEQEALDDGAEPFPVVRIGSLGRRLSAGDDLTAARTLSRIIRDFRPDIVHTHTAKAGFTGRLLAARHRVPVRVHTFHGHLLRGYYGPSATRAVVAAERGLARVSTHLLAVGHRVRQDLLDAGIGRADHFDPMPPGIPVLTPVSRLEARRRLGLAPDVPVIAVVGRMVPIKRLDRAAEVLRQVAAATPDLVVLVAGDGPQRDAFRSTTTGLDVWMLGWRDDVSTVYSAADLALLTSDNEGMPISLIEAGMAARPVVATDVGSVREVVRDGETGLVCGTDAGELAAAVTQLLGSPMLRHRMGSAARDWTVASFSAQRLTRDHEELYQRLLESGGPAQRRTATSRSVFSHSSV